MNILWIPHAPWHTPQREKYLLGYMARDHRVCATDWDTNFRSMRDYVSLRYIKNLVARHINDHDVVVYHVPRVSPALFLTCLRQYNTRIYQEWIARITERHQIDWIIGSFVVPFHDVGVPVTIDVADDNVAYWQEAGRFSDYAREIRDNEQSWLSQSRHVTVVSSVLRERLRSHTGTSLKPVVVIPNGVDLDVFRPADRGATKRILGLDPGCKYLGCMGSFNRSGEVGRLMAVARLIQTMPFVRLILVGSGRLLASLQYQIRREDLTHVLVAGFQEGTTLLQYFQAIDVGLCPYPVTYGLQAASPLRLLQYTAVGATVVIPSLEEVQRMALSNVLFSGETDEEFAQVAIEALDITGPVPDAIHAYHWPRLAERLVEAMTISSRRPMSGM